MYQNNYGILLPNTLKLWREENEMAEFLSLQRWEKDNNWFLAYVEKIEKLPYSKYPFINNVHKNKTYTDTVGQPKRNHELSKS